MDKYLFVILLWVFNPGLVTRGQNNAGSQSCLDCHNNIISNQVIHSPAEESCDNCHQQTGNPHPDENVKGFSLVEEMPGLCFTCHDENDGKNVHAPVESGDCIICHSPHSSPNPSLLVATPTSKLCYDCHDPEISKNNITHQPVREGNCQSCHDPHKSNESSLLKSKMPELCFDCHEKSMQEMTLKYIHPPFEDDCKNCHNVHGSSEPGLLAQTGLDLCYGCHDGLKESIKASSIIHKPVYEKRACMNCHSPHASSQDKYIIMETKELCLSCHNKSISTETRKLSNIRKKLDKDNFIHGAIEIDGCSGCHSSHASNYPSLLTDAFPSGSYAPAKPDNFRLCFNCHDMGMVTVELSKTVTNFRNADQNLHYIHINGDKGRSCKDCHDMHGSPVDHLMASKIAFGDWDMPLTFKVTENGGSCLTGCHSEKKYDRYDFFMNLNYVAGAQPKKIEKYVTKKDVVAADSTETIKLVASSNKIEFNKLLEEFNSAPISPVYFTNRQTAFIDGTDKVIINVINFMKEHPESKMLIEGYTDNAGEKIYDVALSKKRAERVKKIIISFGISSERITTVGYGMQNPAAPNKTKKGREMNRRVEFKLLE